MPLIDVVDLLRLSLFLYSAGHASAAPRILGSVVSAHSADYSSSHNGIYIGTTQIYLKGHYVVLYQKIKIFTNLCLTD